MVRYSIFDPTGNITALVETPVQVERQPTVARSIMDRHPEVEQVGFVCLDAKGEDASLRMAGGEFCGNATMSAAALYMIQNQARTSRTLMLRVSGAAGPVEVRLSRCDENAYEAVVHMPPVRDVRIQRLVFQGMGEELPLVRMEGISHLVIMPSNRFYSLLDTPALAEEAVRAWCEKLRAECLGLMFLRREDEAYRLTPLVYVPGSGTVYWENSCASGSAATGYFLLQGTDEPMDVTFKEPGGSLRVWRDPIHDRTSLGGAVRLVRAYV